MVIGRETISIVSVTKSETFCYSSEKVRSNIGLAWYIHKTDQNNCFNKSFRVELEFKKVKPIILKMNLSKYLVSVNK